MGIKGLARLLSDEAPDSIREVPLSSLHGRKIAIDASMAIYQFLIAVRSGGPNTAATVLTNAEGETTSHVQGIFNRTIRYMSEGIRPVYVFDGKPPSFKSGELAKRREKRELAEKKLAEAKESGNIEEQERQSKRLVRAGTKENADCQKLLGLMGIPVLKAPCEAEAQCAKLAKDGIVYAVGTEDMDALTFQTPVLLRKMTFASGKSDIQTINYMKVINGLDITHDQFVDLCILLGCDYCDSIRGIGPKTALKLIREHKSIETILANIDRKKYGVPDNWVPNESKLKDGEENTDDDNEDDQKNDNEGDKKNDNEDDKKNDNSDNAAASDIPVYVQARELFNNHEVHDNVQLKWNECKVDELSKYLVDTCGFNPDRVKSSIEKLQKAFKATAKPQTRMDSFFKVLPSTKTTSSKRKADEKKSEKKGNKKAATGRKKR